MNAAACGSDDNGGNDETGNTQGAAAGNMSGAAGDMASNAGSSTMGNQGAGQNTQSGFESSGAGSTDGTNTNDASGQSGSSGTNGNGGGGMAGEGLPIANTDSMGTGGMGAMTSDDPSAGGDPGLQQAIYGAPVPPPSGVGGMDDVAVDGGTVEPTDTPDPSAQGGMGGTASDGAVGGSGFGQGNGGAPQIQPLYGAVPAPTK